MIVCECGHLEVEHRLSGKGERTVCDTRTGPRATACPCARLREARRSRLELREREA